MESGEQLIVVVDDSRDNATVLTRLLNRAGYNSLALYGGDELLSHLRESGKPTLVILDVMMPGMDGLQCLRAMRANPGWADVPVFMYSADSSSDKQREAQHLGAQDYIVKGAIRWADMLLKIKTHTSKDPRASDKNSDENPGPSPSFS